MQLIFKSTVLSIFLFTFLHLGLTAQEPTKKETIKWIISKLNSYAYNPVTHFKKEMNFYYDQSTECIICEAATSIDASKYNLFISIPISKIWRVECNSIESTITIRTIGKEIKRSGDLNFSGSDESLGFDFDKESNLKSRMLSAFENLMSFFQKKKETF